MYDSDITHPSKSLEEKLYKLYTLNRDKKIDLSFRPPFLKLLEAFGNPQDSLPPVIHVAGTNGKGSILATLKSIYEAAGYSVHAYTSPHLIRFNERIVIGGKPIGNQSLESLIDEALEINNGAECTFFEITTAIAFAAFARNPADICLLEVGMGGRLDCTNVIKSPAACVINTIGLDHTEFLGETIHKIAGEKAGIMKQNVPCIIGHQNEDETHEVFENKAIETGATLVQSGSQLDQLEPNLKTISLKGEHQKGNINTALTVIEELQNKFSVSKDQIKTGLKSINWPARMQELPSKNALTENTKLWLDGGHNEDAGRAIANGLKEMQKDGKTAVILCMMKHKDPNGFVDQFIEYCDKLIVTQLPNEPASLSVDELSAALTGLTLETAQNYKAALEIATQEAPAHILMTGSLYLAGHVLQDLEEIDHNKE